MVQRGGEVSMALGQVRSALINRLSPTNISVHGSSRGEDRSRTLRHCEVYFRRLTENRGSHSMREHLRERVSQEPS